MTPFRSGSFRWLWSSSLAVATAQGMERTATAWLALSLGESSSGAFLVGLVFAARMLPSLLFGLAAGTFADRSDRARLLSIVGVAGLVLMTSFGWLVGSQSLNAWHVAGLSFMAGCLHVFDTPSRQALTLDIVPRATASNAVALNLLAARAMAGVGAFAGGSVIALSGLAWCYPIIGLAYGVAAVLVTRVRAPRPRPSASERPSFTRAFRDAARLILDYPAVRTLTFASIACEVFAFSFMTAVPVLARDVFNVGPAQFGILNGAAGVGGTLALLALAVLQRRGRLEPILGAVFLTYGASLLTLAVTRDFALAAVVVAVTGACAATFDALQQTLIQFAVPEDQRGRAVGVWMFGIGSAPLGHLEMGAVAATLGAPSALLINGSLVLIAAATLLARAPEYRWRFSGSTRRSIV
jgi:MFS family permease